MSDPTKEGAAEESYLQRRRRMGPAASEQEPLLFPGMFRGSGARKAIGNDVSRNTERGETCTVAATTSEPLNATREEHLERVTDGGETEKSGDEDVLYVRVPREQQRPPSQESDSHVSVGRSTSEYMDKSAVQFEYGNYGESFIWPTSENDDEVSSINRVDHKLTITDDPRMNSIQKDRYFWSDLLKAMPDELKRLLRSQTENHLGAEAYENKDLATAQEHFRKAIQLNPSRIDFYANEAAIYLERGNYEECIRTCEKALRLGSDNKDDYKTIAKLHTHIANAYERQGDLDSALLSMKKSLTIRMTPYAVKQVLEIEKMKKEKERPAHVKQESPLEEKCKEEERLTNANFPDVRGSERAITSGSFVNCPGQPIVPYDTAADLGYHKGDGVANAASLGKDDEHPRTPHYSQFKCRLDSFKEWPLSQYQSDFDLAKAGFYFIGKADLVNCFFCDGCLSNWEPKDDPIIEHARWFPQCGYVRQRMGNDFILVVTEYFAQLNLESASVVCQDNCANPTSDHHAESYQNSEATDKTIIVDKCDSTELTAGGLKLVTDAADKGVHRDTIKDGMVTLEKARLQNLDSSSADLMAGEFESSMEYQIEAKAVDEHVNQRIEQDKNSEQLDKEEERLAKELQQLIEREGGSKSGGSLLKKMGDVYKMRGSLTECVQHFVIASSLYNAALMRCDNPEMIARLETSLRENEIAFFDMLSVPISKIPMNFKLEMKQKLQTIRQYVSLKTGETLRKFTQEFSLEDQENERTELEMIFVQETRGIFMDLQAKMKSFHKELLSKCKEILGPPPQEYTAIAMGSLARGDTTPYSDLEWAILVQDDCRDVEYFRNMVRLMHLFILNVGETYLRTMSIKSLNNLDKPGGNWFVDDVVARGIEFDSALPFACKTPLGRPDRPGKPGLELIKTPANMAKLCEVNMAVKEGYIIDRVLTIVTKLDGSDSLFDKFRSLKAQYQDEEAARKKYAQDMRGLAKEFFPELSFHSGKRTRHDIKREMFRLPSLFVTLFKPLFGLYSDNTWNIICEMSSKDILTTEGGHNLLVLISITALLRLMMYSTKSSQNEQFVLLQTPVQMRQSAEVLFGYSGLHKLVIRYYYSLLPLVEYVNDTPLSAMLNRRKLELTFFEKNYLCAGLIQFYCLCYESARDNFFAQIELVSTEKSLPNQHHPEDIVVQYKGRDIFCDHTEKKVLSCLLMIGNTYKEEGQAKDALEYYSKVLPIMRKNENEAYNILSRKPNYFENLSFVLQVIGGLHSELNQHELALKYHQESLRMHKKIYGKHSDHVCIASSLYQIGTDHSKMNQHELALQHFEESLNMKKRIYDKVDHPDIAGTLNNIGWQHSALGQHQTALKFHQDALNMFKRIYGKVDHPVITTCLNNIGLEHGYLKEHTLALQYLQDSLSMKKRMYGEDDGPDIATSLHRIAMEHYEIGQHELALQYQQDSLSMWKRVRGDVDHPHIAGALNAIAKVHSALGHHETALQCYKDSVSMSKRIDGDVDSITIARMLKGIAMEHCKLRQNQLALIYLLDSLDMMKRIYGEIDHPDIGIVLNHIATNYRLLGEHKFALRYFQDSMTMNMRIYGEVDHPTTASELNNIGLQYSEMGNHEMAVKYLNRALNMRKRMHGDQKNIDIALVFNNLGFSYNALGQHKLALENHQEALGMFRRVYGDVDHPYITLSLNCIGREYAMMGKHEIASRYFQEAMDMYKRVYGEHADQFDVGHLLLMKLQPLSEMP